MSSQTADILLAKPRDSWVLADENGPIDLTGAAVTRTVIGPRPSSAVLVADVPCEVTGLGIVSYDAVPEERVPGWVGYRFRAQWGPAADQVRFFPDTGARWVLVA